MKNFLWSGYRCVVSIAAMSVLILMGLPLLALLSMAVLAILAASVFQSLRRFATHRDGITIVDVEATPVRVDVGPMRQAKWKP